MNRAFSPSLGDTITKEEDVQISIDIVQHDQQCVYVCCQHQQQVSQEEMDSIQRQQGLILTRAKTHLLKLKEMRKTNKLSAAGKKVGVVDQSELHNLQHSTGTSPLTQQQSTAVGAALLVNANTAFYKGVLALHSQYTAAFTSVSSTYIVSSQQQPMDVDIACLRRRALPFYQSPLPQQAYLPYLYVTENTEVCKCLKSEAKQESQSKRSSQTQLPDNIVGASVNAAKQFYDLCLPGNGMDYYRHQTSVTVEPQTNTLRNDDLQCQKITQQRAQAGMGALQLHYQESLQTCIFNGDISTLPPGSTLSGNVVYTSAPWKNDTDMQRFQDQLYKHNFSLHTPNTDDIMHASCPQHASIWKQHGSVEPVEHMLSLSTDSVEGLVKLQLHQLYDSLLGIEHNENELAKLVVDLEQQDPQYTDITDTLHLAQNDCDWETENDLTTSILQLNILPQYSVTMEDPDVQQTVQQKTAKEVLKLMHPQTTVIQNITK